jgi:hypothetical protein
MPKAQWATGKITVVQHPKKFTPKQKLNWGIHNVMVDFTPRIDDVRLVAAFVADVVVTLVKPCQFDLQVVRTRSRWSMRGMPIAQRMGSAP